MAKYVAKRNCIYGESFYRDGDILHFNKEPVVCPDCNGKAKETICKLCKDSGRVDPPHHFKNLPSDDNKDRKVNNGIKEKLSEETKEEEIGQLRKQIEALGGSYSKVWGVERLRTHLIKVQKEYGNKNVASPTQ
jgi:hypothetical protein